jgi:lysosome membrane protein 2
MQRRKSIAIFCSALLCVVAFFLGIAGPIFIQNQVKDGIRSQVVVDSFDSSGYSMWQSNANAQSPPTYQQFNLFNITNPNEVLEGAKPMLVEIGPYSYRKYHVYLNVSFSADGNERQFREWEYYVFDPATSFEGASPETDSVNVINVPYQAVMGALFLNDQTNLWWKSLAFDVLASYTNSSLITRLNVSALLFGYQDPLLSLVSELQPNTPATFGLQPNQTEQDALNSATTTFYTGKNDINQLGVYKKFEGKTSETCWGSPAANAIFGTDASGFYPGVSMQDLLPVFVDNLFRSAYLAANDSIEVFGIKLLNFGLRTTDLDNATVNPANAGFYQYGPGGVINLTSCSQGAPVFVSKPHFLDADPYYLSQLDGLNPNRSLHETIIAVEPYTGVTMYAHKRLQINVKLQEDMLLHPQLRKNLYVPVVWIDEGGGITEDIADEFKGKIYLAETVIVVLQWVGLGCGIVFFVSTIAMFVVFWRQQKKSDDYIILPSGEQSTN